MKKLFLLFSGIMLCAMYALALTPDEILGKWNYKVNETDPTGGLSTTANVNYDFKTDDKISSDVDFTLTIEQAPVKISVFTKIKVDGTYKVDGDSIVVNFDKDTFEMNFTEDDIRIIGVEDVAQQNQMKEQMFANMQQMLPAMTEGMAQEDVFTNVVVLDKKMTCVNEGKMVTLKRKKK